MSKIVKNNLKMFMLEIPQAMPLRKMHLIEMLVLFILLPELVLSAREPPMVTIPDQGTLSGTYLKMFRIQSVIGYLGIPYAQPPTGILRFSPPIVDDLPSWDGVRNASVRAPDCWQSTLRRTKRRHDEIFSSLLTSGAKDDDTEQQVHTYDEDCLYLNVYIPDAPPPPDGYAVIVWLHSGDFSHGSPFEINPFQLVFKQKVIVVTVAYRLNIFGFLTTIDGEAPGNFGLMDQSAALLWVNRNIEYFNGNKSSLTLMGHGAGAISTALHLTSGEWSEEMFTRAMIMSPIGILDNAVKDAKAYEPALESTSNTFGCVRRPTSLLIECLRRVNPQVLIDTGPEQDWGPIVDAGLSNTTLAYVPDFPKTMLEKGLMRKIPVLIGYTDTEEGLEIAGDPAAGITHELYESMIGEEILNDLAQMQVNDTNCDGNAHVVVEAVHFMYKPFPPVTDSMHLKRKLVDFTTERYFVAPIMTFASLFSRFTEVYVYRFDMKPRTSAALKGIPVWMGVPHKYDLIYVWGLPYWVRLTKDQQWETTDKRISDIIMTLWANFAKFANPTELGIYIRWDNFTQENPSVLIIDRNFNMSDHNTLNYRAVKFWNEYYPKVLEFASTCCNGSFLEGGGAPYLASYSIWSLIVIAVLHQILFRIT